MGLKDLFASIEMTMLAKFKESGFIQHNGDKGENREELLMDFLQKHLPSRYGVTKGEVLTQSGQRSHAVDIIIYDAVNCPILYSGKTSILPMEGIYGIIEVKSSLSKTEFDDAAKKIASFKELAPRDLGVVQTEEHVTLVRPSRPFGIVLGYQLAGNSLESLKQNWQAQCAAIHNVNYFVNLICVLGEGLLRYEHVDFSAGEKHMLLDTDEFVNLVLTAHKRATNNEAELQSILRIVIEGAKDATFGRFFTYLLVMLTKMKLRTPEIGRYIDPDMPITVMKV